MCSIGANCGQGVRLQTCVEQRCGTRVNIITAAVRCKLLRADRSCVTCALCSLFFNSNVAAPAPRKSLKEISSEIQAVIRQVSIRVT
jgi:hypothetical protein